MISSLRIKPSLLVTLTAFCLVCVAYGIVWPQAPLQSLDSPTYIALARQIKAGRITTLSQRTPGLPLLLLATGSETVPRRLLFHVQMMLHFASLGMIASLLSYLGVGRGWIITLLVLGSLPVYVVPAAYADSESFCEFLVVVSVVFLVLWLITRRYAYLTLFGFAGLASALVRPTYQFLCVAEALIVVAVVALGLKIGPDNFSQWRSVLSLSIPVAISLLGLGAYALFNYMHFGYFSISSLPPYSMSTKTASFVEELPDEFADVRSILLKHRDRELLIPHSDHTAPDYIHRAMPEVIAFYGDQVKALQVVGRANRWLILHKPMSYVIECLRAMPLYWLPMEYPLLATKSSFLRALSAGFQIFVSILLLVIGTITTGVGAVLVGIRLHTGKPPVFTNRTEHRVWAYIAAMTAVVYSAVFSSWGGTGIPRYRVTSDLLILGCCILGISLLNGAITEAVRLYGSVEETPNHFLIRRGDRN